IQQAVREGVPPGVVLADNVYGSHREFRAGVAELKLRYSLGVKSTTTVWARERQALPPQPGAGKGRPARRLRRDRDHLPYTAEELARALPQDVWRKLSWREGSKKKLQSRFAAVCVRPAYGDDRKIGVQAEQWLLIEWPEGEPEPARYWLSNLPRKTPLQRLVRITKQRWRIERDHEELKQEVGLGHYEGRNWRGFHHHGTLCIAAYGFLLAERSRFSPSARAGHLGLRAQRILPRFRPRGSPGPRPAA
ncbi:MAG: IS701 family transposase, partial [Gammaproteobacteria bacterium]